MIIILGVLVLMYFAFFFSNKKATKLITNNNSMNSASNYGWFSVLVVGIFLALTSILWVSFNEILVDVVAINNVFSSNLSEKDISALLYDAHNIIERSSLQEIANLSNDSNANILIKEIIYLKDIFYIGFVFLVLGIGGILFALTYYKINENNKVKTNIEKIIKLLMVLSVGITTLTTFGIIISLSVETIRFFNMVSVVDFLFGTSWEPQGDFGENKSSGSFGVIPVLLGTFVITFIALFIAIPSGMCVAIYLSEYASSKIKHILKASIEILAGIPTVVYGFFAVMFVAPVFKIVGNFFGLDIASESAIVGGMVMGIMLIPFVSSLSSDVISAVPDSLRQASLALGTTKSEAIRNVILPAALPGIIASFLLATSRAVGETMIVVMASGMAAKMTINPLESVTTMTVQIMTMLVGDQEFDSPKTLSAFALGSTLFLVTLILNIISLKVVNKYREKYD